MVKLFADTAKADEISRLIKNHNISGITTNPSIMFKSGVGNYEAWAKGLCASFPDQQISFEVTADNFRDMKAQAQRIASWGDNVYVKIPVMNTKGDASTLLIQELAENGVQLNVTAVFTRSQIDEVMGAFTATPAIISIFAGRIADTGRDPTPTISYALERKSLTTVKVLWASPRQVFDVYTADSIGCDIITCTPEILGKLNLEGKNLIEFSRATVQMFYDDAKQAGYNL